MTLWASVFTRLKPHFQPGAVFPFAFELAEPEAAPGVGEWTSAWESGARCLLPGGRLGFCFAGFPPVGLGWSEGEPSGGLVARSPGPLVPCPVPGTLGPGGGAFCRPRTHTQHELSRGSEQARGIQDTPKTRAMQPPPPLVPEHSHRPGRQARGRPRSLRIGSPWPCLPPVPTVA